MKWDRRGLRSKSGKQGREGEGDAPLIQAITVDEIVLRIGGKANRLTAEFGDLAQLKSDRSAEPLARFPVIDVLQIAGADFHY